MALANTFPSKQSLWIVGILSVLFLVVDPLAYHSFTAPKNTLFILLSSSLLVFLFFKKKQVSVGIIAILIFLRILWLASTNTSWVLHPSNDGFLLTIGLFCTVLVTNSFQGKGESKSFFEALFFIGIIQVLVGIWQLMTYVPSPEIPIKTYFIGTFGTSNGLGVFLVISFICGLYLVYIKKNKVLSILGSAILLVGIILSESRGSILALVASLSGWGVISLLKSNRIRFKKSVSTVLIFFFCTVALFLYQIDARSSSGRLMIWEITLEMIQDRPLTGIGHGNFSREYLTYQAEYFKDPEHIARSTQAANIKQAHNEFLQSFAEGGLLGGILLVSIWIVPFVRLTNKLFQENTVNSELVVHLGIHTTILVHSMLDSPLHVLPIAILGYANIGSSERILFSLKPKKLIRRVFQTLSILLFCFVLIKQIYAYPGHHMWKEGTEHISAKEWKVAINDLSKAENRLPKKGELLYQLGAAHVFDNQYSRGTYFINESKKFYNDRNIHLTESYGLFKLKKFESAIESALLALEMFPTHLAPHLLLGEIYFYTSEIELSKESLMKCIKEDIPIKSVETKQISEDARALWEQFYGELE